MGHGCHALTSIAGPNDINYRYLTEDIPVALVCWASIGDLAGVDTPIMDAVITLIGVAHDTDWFAQRPLGRKAGAHWPRVWNRSNAMLKQERSKLNVKNAICIKIKLN